MPVMGGEGAVRGPGGAGEGVGGRWEGGIGPGRSKVDAVRCGVRRQRRCCGGGHQYGPRWVAREVLGAVLGPI